MIPVRRLAEVESVEVGLGQLGDEHRRDPIKRCAPLLVDGREHFASVERLRGDDHAGAVGRAREIADHHPEAVVERHGHAYAVVLGVAERSPGQVRVVEDVAVRQRRALGGSGRPGRVLDVDRVLGAQLFLTRRELALADPRALGQERAPLAFKDDHHPQAGAGRRHLGEHRDVVGLPEAPSHHQQAHAGLAQRVLELGGLVRRVDRDEDRADSRGRELQDEPLVAARRPDPDAVAVLHAVCDQRTGGEPDLLPQLAVGGAVALVADDQRLAVREAPDRAAQVRSDRLLQQRDVSRSALVGERARAGGAGVGQEGRFHCRLQVEVR